MVNKTIFEYLKKYRGEFPLSSLREKILSRGYKQEDFEEALHILENEKNRAKKEFPFTPKQIILHSGLERSGAKIPFKGFKWMKASGIIGSILLFGLLFLFIFNVVGYEIGSIQSSIIFYTLLAGLMLGVFLYLFGFYKLGVFTDVKMLRVSSLLLSIGLLLPLILLMFLINSTGYSTFIQNPSTLLVPPLFSYLLLGAGVFDFVMVIFFSMGLIKTQDSTSFSKAAGITNFTLIGISAVIFFLIYYLSFNNLSAFISISNVLLTISWWSVASLGMLSRVFEIIVLFKASKEFE